MLRLYPIRYRRLPKAAQFNRFDLVELRVEKPKDDHRPESHHVDEESIRILEHGTAISNESKVRLWRQHVAPSLKALQQDNKTQRRSLGIVRPDPGSLRFFVRPIAEANEQDQAIAESLIQQNSLFEDPLTPMQRSGYVFGYRFTSDGHSHEHMIHDWEVQAAFFQYRKRYGDNALAMLTQEYGDNIPQRNLHFILGTMKAHPTTFIVIGLLRSPVAPEDLERQGDLF